MFKNKKSDRLRILLVLWPSQFHKLLEYFSAGQITLVALAPLTNVALAVNLDPEFPKKLKEIIIMGGNTEGKNSNWLSISI